MTREVILSSGPAWFRRLRVRLWAEYQRLLLNNTVRRGPDKHGHYWWSTQGRRWEEE